MQPSPIPWQRRSVRLRLRTDGEQSFSSCLAPPSPVGAVAGFVARGAAERLAPGMDLRSREPVCRSKKMSARSAASASRSGGIVVQTRTPLVSGSHFWEGRGWNRHLRASACLLSAVFVLPSAGAGIERIERHPLPVAADEATKVALPDLLAVALGENPEIRAADARYQSMLQRPIQEGTLPDPMLGVRFHNEQFDRITLGESEFSYLEFSAEQELPFPGKLGLREKIAGLEAGRERAMRDATTLMVLARVAATYAQLTVIDRSSDILRESIATLDLMKEQAATSYGVGTAAQQDVLRATLERGALEERLTMLLQQRAAGAAEMSALLNRPAEQDLPVTVWAEDVSPLEPYARLAERLAEQAPELRAAAESVLREGAAVDLAEREYFPDFTAMVAYMNKDDLFPEWEVGLRVTVPLYFWRKQRAALAEANLARSAAEHTRQNVRVTLEARLRQLHSMGEAAYRLIELYRDGLIPQASLTLESARASYAVGNVDFLTMLTAFTSLLEYQMRYAEQIGGLAQARAEIAPLIGETPLGERLEVP
jgi:outer membrane protein, heavy metal efflux system